MYHPEDSPVSDPIDVLPDHTLEHILARIPLPSVCATRCVSKRWRSLTTSPTFLALYSQLQEQSESWLYVNGFRYKITDLTSSPNAISSPNPPAPKIPGHSWGAGGLTYVLPDPSPHQNLHYKLSTLDPQWQETPSLTHPRTLPIIGAIKNLENGAHKVICAGGLPCDASKESLSKVELFDSESQAWEESEDLPGEFQGLSTSRSVTAVVCNRKLYLFHIYSGIVTSFDVITKRWSTVKTLRPPGTQYCYLAVRNGGLLLVGVTNENDNFLFRGWNVDQAFMVCSGPSWPVLCHFASVQTPVDVSKKKQEALSHSMDVFPSASLQPVVCKYFVAVSGCLSKIITIITGVFDAVLEFNKAIS